MSKKIFDLISASLFLVMGIICMVAGDYWDIAQNLQISGLIFIVGGLIGAWLLKYYGGRYFLIIFLNLIPFALLIESSNKSAELILFSCALIISITLLWGSRDIQNNPLTRSLFRKIGFPGTILWLLMVYVTWYCDIGKTCGSPLMIVPISIMIIAIGFGFLIWCIEMIKYLNTK